MLKNAKADDQQQAEPAAGAGALGDIVIAVMRQQQAAA